MSLDEYAVFLCTAAGVLDLDSLCSLLTCERSL